MIALALSLVLPLATPPSRAARPADPPIRIRLSEEVYTPGERAKVKVKTTDGGFLLVLRMDGAGRVRVLFPVDPLDSTSISGGKEYEIVGRGDRETFIVDEAEGRGLVLAAISAAPFRFEEFTRNGHWDYRALALMDSSPGDSEARLLDLVDRMAGGNYNYDLATYEVWPDRRSRSPSHAGWYGPRYYDPWYHNYSPFYGPRFGFRIVIGGGRFGGRHRRWW